MREPRALGTVPVVIPAVGSGFTVSAQTDVGQRVEELSSRVARLESRTTTSAGAAVFALLAKNADDLKTAGGAASTGSRTVVLAIVLGALLITTFLALYWMAA